MTTAPERKIIIIAGPNGAGKTTFAAAFRAGRCTTTPVQRHYFSKKEAKHDYQNTGPNDI